MTYIHINTLKSRKNCVKLIKELDNDSYYIMKIMGDVTKYEREIYYLRMLREHGLTVPSIVDTHKGEILMTYLGPRTLLDEIVAWEENTYTPFNNKVIIHTFRKLIKWLDHFYTITYEATGKSIRLGDIHFRNFLVSNQQLYGIDFEECCVGEREMDGGRLCAYLLTYNPMFTKCKIMYTIQLIRLLTEEFHYNEQSLMDYMEKELKEINQRRWNGEQEAMINRGLTIIGENIIRG